FAGMINISRSETGSAKASAPSHDSGSVSESSDDEDEPPPRLEDTVVTEAAGISPAPAVHIAQRRGAPLIDYPHGSGRIVVLSDPYIVANGGIQLADNLQLAVNTIASGSGLIAFDEYHQGRGISQNEFAAYFAGTPVLAICGQLVLIVLAVVWTRSRRFARPLPLPQVDRRSSLEYVGSMAE